MQKYKYYWKKPRSEIVKDVLVGLLVGGALVVGGGMAGGAIARNLWAQPSLKKYPKRKVQSTFSYLRRRGLLEEKIVNNQLYISLTSQGKKKAGLFQLHELGVSRPKKWDGKWRVLLFDISEKKKVRREALRGMLLQLGFFQLQKSVWMHAFDCSAEIDLLRDFFGFSELEMRLIIAENIGETATVKAAFGLS